MGHRFFDITMDDASFDPETHPRRHSLPARVSLVDQTTDMVKQLITSQRWIDFLPGEDALGTQFGISRVTLRKALAALAEQGWIIIGGRGKRHAIIPRPSAESNTPVQRGGVKCISPFPKIELALSTRVILDDIRKSLLSNDLRLEFYHRASLWRGDPSSRLAQLCSDPNTVGWVLYRASREIQEWFQMQHHIPCVVLGPCHEGIKLPSVEVDDLVLGRHIAAEATRLGHWHLAYIVYDSTVASSLSTIEGLRQLAPRDGRKGKVTLIEDDTTVAHLRKSITQLMADEDPPTLFVVTEADHAMPVMGILAELNLQIPRDVSIVVRDHEPFLSRSVPEFTRYTFDWQRFGRYVAKILCDNIKGSVRKSTTHRKLLPVLIPGQTFVERRKD